MPEYLAPGVYIEEIPSGNMPIQAASTSTAGMVGCTARGPVGVPTLVTSLGAYARIFGGRLDPLTFTDGRDALPYAAEGFFGNGGARLYVVRVTGGEAIESTADIASSLPLALRLDGAAPAGGNSVVLASVAGLAVGQSITLAGVGHRLTAIDTATRRVTFTGPLAVPPTPASMGAFAASAAAAVGDTALGLDGVAGLQVGQVLLIGGTTHAITAIAVATRTVTLGTPLAAAVAVGDAVQQAVGLADAATGSATQLRQLAAGAAAAVGATKLRLASVAGVTPGMVLTVGGTDHAVGAVDEATDTVTLAPALAAAVAVGDSVLAPQAAVLRVHARWPGAWGNSLRISRADRPILQTTLVSAAAAGGTVLDLTTAFGLFPGSVVAIGSARAEVLSVDTTAGTATLTAALTAAAPAGTAVISQEFALTVERIENGRVVEAESFDRMSLASEHPRFMGRIVGTWNAATGRPSDSGGSNLIRLENLADATSRVLPIAAIAELALAGGDDDVAGIDDDALIGTISDDPAARTGIQALGNEPTLSLVAVPGRTGAAGANDVAVQSALVQHCENVGYRFAVLEVPLGATVAQARAHRQNFDSTRCAVYYPGLVIPDSFGNPGDRRTITSAGHMLGVIARTDITRGVHKAPANEVVRGILGLETRLTKGEQDILNPINLNCYRDFREENRGLRIYGGRVATSNPEFRYINVRRLMLMVEQSLDTGLQWAVFEPNAEPLWATVKQSVTGFLTTIWRDGALEGVKAEEAFFVNIGYDLTMTQDDIDNGRMILEIGIAPVKPAEFVIVRISQKTREATA